MLDYCGAAPENSRLVDIFKEAAALGAEEIRFTAFLPTNSFDIRLKLSTRDGRPCFWRCEELSFREGTLVIRALCMELCGCAVSEPETLPIFDTTLLPAVAIALNLERARVRSRAVHAQGVLEGFITEVHLTHRATCSSGEARLLRFSA